MTTTRSYKLKECPYCHRHFANVKNHIAMKHQAELPHEFTRADLLGEPAAPKPGVAHFYCDDCGGDVREGEQTCSHCGVELDWS